MTTNNHSSHQLQRKSWLATSLAAGLIATTPAAAQTNGTWVGGGGNSIWGGPANWENSQIAGGGGTTALFANAFGNGREIRLNITRNIGNVVYTDPGAETEMSLVWFSNQPTVTLNLVNGLLKPTFNVTQPDRILTVTARLNGTNGFVKTGPGAMILDIPGSAPNHPVSGSIVIEEGILSLAESAVLANATLDTTNSVLGDVVQGLRFEIAEVTLGGITGNKDLASIFTTTSGGYDLLTSLTLSSSATTTAVFTGAIANSAAGMSIIKTGPGSQALLGANTYTGTTTLADGTLILSTAGFAGTGITTSTNTILGVQVADDDEQLAINGDLVLGDNSTLRVNYGDSTPSTISAVLDVEDFTIGLEPIVQITLDTLLDLAPGQSYPLVSWAGTGPSDASDFTLELPSFRMEGELQITGSTLFLNITANGAGPISWNTGDGNWDTTTANWLDAGLLPTTYFDTQDEILFGDASGATGDPVINVSAGYAPLSVTMDTTGRNYTIASVFGGIDGSGPITLAPTNQGTLTIETENLYTGPITVNGGTLALSGPFASLGSGASLTMDGGKFDLGGESSSVSSVDILQADSSGDTIANGSLSASSFTVSHPAGEVAISASLAGTGTLIMSSPGTLILSGVNTYGGTTGILDGTLKLGVEDALPTTNVTVNGLLDLNTFSNTIGGLSGDGTVDTPAGGSPTLTVNANNANSTFNGLLQNSSGTLSLTKAGSGTLTLTNENTLSGVVTLEDGILAISNINPFPNVSGITLGDGTRLQANVVNAVIDAPVTLGGLGTTATINAPTIPGDGGTIPVPFTFNGPITGDGNITFVGTQSTNAYGTIFLNGASTYTGNTLVTCINSTNTQIAVFLGTENALPTTTVLTLDGGPGTGSGRRASLDLKGHNQTLAGLTNVARNLRTQHVFNTAATAATLTINNTDAFTYSGQLGGNEANGNFGIAKSGPGSLTLTGVRNHSGSTTVNEGALTLGTINTLDEGATFSIASSGATVALTFEGTDTIGQLIIGGVNQGTGTFGHSDSGATNGGLGVGALDAYFAPGTGTLTVDGALTGYAAWAAINAPVTGGDPAADEDADGVPNALEYVLGGTSSTNDLDKLPTLTLQGDDLVFTFIRDQDSIDGQTTVSIEVGTTLADWPASYPVPDSAAANNPGITVIKGSPAPDQDTVTLTLPQNGDPKKFARMKVDVGTH